MTNFSILIGHNRHNLYKHSIPNEKKTSYMLHNVREAKRFKRETYCILKTM